MLDSYNQRSQKISDSLKDPKISTKNKNSKQAKIF